MNKIKSFIEKVKRFLVTALTKSRTKKILFIKYIIFSVVLFLTIFLGYVLYLFNNLPNIESLSQPQKRQKIVLLDNKGEILSIYGDMHSNYMHYYEIPRNLINAVVATEDRKFFQHFGIDTMGILRAAVTNLQAGRTVQGGSTISQQLAKISFLSSERTLKRKLKEALLAFEIENRYSKQEIMEIYLNKVYLGSGIFGVSAAAKYYFAKNIQDLNLYECAILAGLLKSPSRFSPKNNRDLSGNRAYQILINMHDAGFINKIQLDNAKNKSVILNTKLLGSVKKDFFTNHIYEQTFRYINPKESSNLTVRTTFDTHIQNIATQELKRQSRVLQRSRNGSEGAIIIMDHQGDILSMVGGVDFYKSSFNRAINAYRPTGSIFKTIVYTAAIEKGFLPTDVVEDKELQYGEWSPRNFNRTFLGKVSLEEAFRKSLNTIPVQLMQKIGINNVVRTARELGIKSKIYHNLSSSLGSSSANLIEMTTAYAIIANNGLAVAPKSIESIRNNLNEQVLYNPKMNSRKRVVSEDTIEHMKMLLRRAVVDGSARRALSSFKVSGKTGTSQDYRDAWFVGYTDQHVIGVWIGNDDFSPMKYVTGSTFPTVIARNILRKITR